jgi:hypothetical protein
MHVRPYDPLHMHKHGQIAPSAVLAKKFVCITS